MDKKKETLQRMAEDIRDIRKTLNKNRDLIQKWLNTGPVVFISIYSGILVTAFSLAHYFLIQYYRSYGAVPLSTRSILIIGFIIAMAIPGIMKMVSLVSINDRYPDSKSIGLVIRLFGASHLLYCLVLEILIVLLCVYFGMSGIPQFCVPVISIGFGILMTATWSHFTISELMLFGLWFIVTGLICLPFIARAPNDAWIWLAVSVGLGCFLLPAFTRIKSMFRKG